MKKKFLLVSKITGLILFYSLVLIASIFLTMSILIKGEEISAPNLIGKSLRAAYQVSSSKGIYLKKEIINFDKNYKPLTVIDQFPAPNTLVKEKSFIKVYVTAEVTEVILPDLSNQPIKDCHKILAENNLKKRYLSYINSNEIPMEHVISQSIPPGSRVASGTGIDILVSKGIRDTSFIMPFIIGMEAEKVVYFFESRGFKISKITRVPYSYLEPGIVVKQFPSPGFRINPKNLISIQISE
ncbi:MAG: PASTA domain-containing protein [Candidatus Aminicenantes bacterium]|nr:PASTA domain-containing protein [Candidatus Aminicenantes bacterium]